MNDQSTPRTAFDAKKYIADRKAAEARLIDAGAYHPDMEHDACGVGFIAAVAVSYTHLTLPTTPYV